MLAISCPTCRKSAQIETIQAWPNFPFCSPRCKLIDLGNWLGEAYHLPTSELAEDAAVEESAQ